MSDPNAPQQAHAAPASPAEHGHGHAEGEGHGHEVHKVNAWLIFIWLVVLTALEIGIAMAHEHGAVGRKAMVWLVIATAIIKAGLVGTFFMHLKFEGKLIWGMVIGSILLGCVYLGLLFPDIVFGTLNLFR